MSDVVQVSFWAAFIIDIIIIIYSIYLIKRMGKGGTLGKVTLYAGISALIFGIHHVMELFLEEIPAGIAVAEGVEAVAAVILGIAVYQLYKLTVFE